MERRHLTSTHTKLFRRRECRDDSIRLALAFGVSLSSIRACQGKYLDKGFRYRRT